MPWGKHQSYDLTPLQSQLKEGMTPSSTTGIQLGNIFCMETKCTSSTKTLGHSSSIQKHVNNKQASKETQGNKHETKHTNQPLKIEVSAKVLRGDLWDSMAGYMEFRQCTAHCAQPQQSIHSRSRAGHRKVPPCGVTCICSLIPPQAFGPGDT